ncbi:MAG: hypothetical protein GY757_34000 [bacterium]|nr:hypothetical protein [bacterium]
MKKHKKAEIISNFEVKSMMPLSILSTLSTTFILVHPCPSTRNQGGVFGTR